MQLRLLSSVSQALITWKLWYIEISILLYIDMLSTSLAEIVRNFFVSTQKLKQSLPKSLCNLNNNNNNKWLPSDKLIKDL